MYTGRFFALMCTWCALMRSLHCLFSLGCFPLPSMSHAGTVKSLPLPHKDIDRDQARHIQCRLCSDRPVPQDHAQCTHPRCSDSSVFLRDPHHTGAQYMTIDSTTCRAWPSSRVPVRQHWKKLAFRNMFYEITYCSKFRIFLLSWIIDNYFYLISNWGKFHLTLI